MTTIEENIITIQKRFAKLMEEKHVTVKDVAQDTGIKLVRMKRYVNGDIGKMPLSEINLLADYFDVASIYLMGRINYMKYIFNCSFENTPKCKKCMLSFSKMSSGGKSKFYCAALGARPHCPDDGCRKDCPLLLAD